MANPDGFDGVDGWSAIDTNRRLDTRDGRLFVSFLTRSGVEVVIRYYAATQSRKTMTRREADYLSRSGFHLLPVYQDSHREAQDFGARKGRFSACNARRFAHGIGQPEGSTILFAVDGDLSRTSVIDGVVPYFEAVCDEIDGQFRIGAYASGLALRILLDRDLISVPWLSMDMTGRGTRDFFRSGRWALRQVAPEQKHEPTGIGYDRNILEWSLTRLGAFQLPRCDYAQYRRGSTVSGGVTTRMRVRTDGLDLRTGPEGEVIRTLTIGEPVVDMGPDAHGDWRAVDVGGQRGVVLGRYLRDQQAPQVERFVDNAVAEWLVFDRGQAKEDVSPYDEFVAEMWQSIGLNFSGKSHYDNGDEVPWSAAFISFVVGQSGDAYASFRFAPRHSVFVHDAIQARILERKDRPFWGYRSTEAQPQIGDIIQCNRGSGHMSFDFAQTHSQYDSHSDIVVEVTDHVVRVIGGNVTDSVSMREYDLNQAGYLSDGQGIIALLKNRAADVR